MVTYVGDVSARSQRNVEFLMALRVTSRCVTVCLCVCVITLTYALHPHTHTHIHAYIHTLLLQGHMSYDQLFDDEISSPESALYVYNDDNRSTYHPNNNRTTYHPAHSGCTFPTRQLQPSSQVTCMCVCVCVCVICA